MSLTAFINLKVLIILKLILIANARLIAMALKLVINSLIFTMIEIVKLRMWAFVKVIVWVAFTFIYSL